MVSYRTYSEWGRDSSAVHHVVTYVRPSPLPCPLPPSVSHLRVLWRACNAGCSQYNCQPQPPPRAPCCNDLKRLFLYHCDHTSVKCACERPILSPPITSPFGDERVYLPLCKVADTPFHIQGVIYYTCLVVSRCVYICARRVALSTPIYCVNGCI